MDLSRVVEAYLWIELTPNSSNVGRKNMPLSHERILRKNVLEVLNGTSESELSLTTEEKRLIKVAVLQFMEDADNFFVFLFPFREARDLKIGV